MLVLWEGHGIIVVLVRPKEVEMDAKDDNEEFTGLLT